MRRIPDSMLEAYKNNIRRHAAGHPAQNAAISKLYEAVTSAVRLGALPYATGLFPYLISPEISLHFMPSLKEAKKLSFSKQSSVGFQQAIASGLDLFFGMSSIIYGISRNFNISSSKSGGLKSIFKMKPVMLYRLLKAQ
jgi:hypothetical protein